MSKRKITPEIVLSALLVLAATLLPITPAMAGEPAAHTTANVYWNWDTAAPIGTSELIRSRSGITAVYKASGLPAGQALTLWAIVFNNPENCYVPFSCVGPADVFNPAVDGDFHFLSGNVVGGTDTINLAGHLNVGDTSGSGRAEIGDNAFALRDPYKADVVLAIHSHGPKLTGQGLKSPALKHG